MVERGRRDALRTVLRAWVQFGLVGLVALAAWPTVAQVSVSSSGSPSYSHPIAVPPGISGMQPNLGLLYSGGGVNGPVGHGWSVQGISMITRCPATRSTDGVPRGVRFDVTDKLCLDGQRLIQTDESGSPTATQNATGVPVATQANDAQGPVVGQYREYRTEKDSFARIRAYGVASVVDPNGPTYFKVWTKAGQVYEYGSPPTATATTGAVAEDAAAPAVNPSGVVISNGTISAQGKTAVMAWAVSRISDVVGNYIAFKYEQRDVAWGSGPTSGSPTLGREWNLAEIQYTGNGAQVPANKVVFRYTNRPISGPTDVAEAYQQGSKNVSVRLLQSIETYVNSPNPTTLGPAAGAVPVRTIKLTHDDGPISKRKRLVRITECAGGPASTNCLPAVRLNYANGGNEAFTANSTFGSSSLATTAMYNTSGPFGTSTVGIIPLDYDGDGRTDFILWNHTPSVSTPNQLWRSNGNGSFTQVTSFSVATDKLFSANGCDSTMVMDFNSDGLPDLLRTTQFIALNGQPCPTQGPNLLFLNQGDGTFTSVAITGVNLSRNNSSVQHECPGTCEWNFTGWTYGETFFVMDVDGDGKLDIVTSILPAVSPTQAFPPDPCLSTVCTRIYIGNGNGGFTERPGSIVANKSLYVNNGLGSSFRQQRNVIDIDGDGLADIAAAGNPYLPTQWRGWRSLGNGDFESVGTAGSSTATCDAPVDFNGDGRADCIYAKDTVTSNSLWTSDGSSQFKLASAFNLNVAGAELTGVGIGFEAIDLNGDGRTDVLRWKDDAANNVVYFSNGNGSFASSVPFRVDGSAVQLGHSDGGTTFTMGDFLGNGSVQILRLKLNPSAGAGSSNQLYVKSDPTPADQLSSVISPTGLKTTLTYALLANAPSGRYTSDRGTANAATYPLVDLTVASTVVISSQTDSGVGSNTVTTEYAYRGLKAAVDGRGLLGFRQTVQGSKAPNGADLSVFTDYLLDEPYAGVARRTETRLGPWSNASAQLLSRTVNIYCDRTSATAPSSATETTPCATNARVRRPYLRQSVETGNDLGGNVLPTVTTVNTYDDWGNPTDIVVTTQGSYAGLASQTFTKATANTFCAPNSASCPNITSGDNWILGRLTRSQVTNTVPNVLDSIGRTPGGAALASATSGTLQATLALSSCSSTSPTTTPMAATMSCTLSNTGVLAAGSISYSTPAGTTVSGPTGACAAGATCGMVTLTTATSAGTYSGTLTATPNVGSAASQAVNLVVLTQGALSFSGCSSISPTTSPAAASMSCTLSNIGQTGVSSISYSTAPSTTVSGPTAACAAGATCGTVTVTTATGAATYSGTLTATPNVGSPTSQGISLQVLTPGALAFSGCTYNNPTTTPTAATMSCTLSNTGQTGVSSISYSTAPSTTVSGPTGACAAGATCGTVTVTTATGAATYSGTLAATPNVGNPSSQAISLQVRTQATLTFSACSSNSPTTTPTAATMSCTLSNTGQTDASSISYSTAASTTVSGPTGACAAGATCGTVTVTTGTSAQTYSGTLTASPNSGIAGSQGINLQVRTQATLAFSGCSSTTPTTSPTAATMSCTLSNTGQTGASSISYSTAANTSVSGPTGACAAGATCGTVTVTTATTAGTYSGTLTASPNSGISGSQGISLTVNAGTTTLTRSPTSLTYGTVSKDSFMQLTLTLTNGSSTPALGLTYTVAYTSGTIQRGSYGLPGGGTCPASGGNLAGGASCTLIVQYTAFCTAGSRNGNLTIAGNNFTSIVTTLTATTSSAGVCN